MHGSVGPLLVIHKVIQGLLGEGLDQPLALQPGAPSKAGLGRAPCIASFLRSLAFGVLFTARLHLRVRCSGAKVMV